MAFVLRHAPSGRYYCRMTLGHDVQTYNEESARKWSTEAAAERFAARFGDQYEVEAV